MMETVEDLKATIQQREDELRTAAASKKLVDAQLATANKLIKEDKELTKRNIQKLKTLLSRAPECTGENRAELRNFIESVDGAKKYSGATDQDLIPELIALLKCPLKSGVDGFIQSQESCTWESIKEFIQTTYLAIDEQHFLQRAVDMSKQTITEDIRTFALRFAERVRKAYSEEELQAEYLQRDLVKKFITGIDNANIRQEIWKTDPKKLHDAITQAVAQARAFDLAHPESMGIGLYATNREEAMDTSITKLVQNKQPEQTSSVNIPAKINSNNKSPSRHRSAERSRSTPPRRAPSQLRPSGYNKENIQPRAHYTPPPSQRWDWQRQRGPSPAPADRRARPQWSPAARRSPSPWSRGHAPSNTVKFADETRHGQMSNFRNREQPKLCYYCQKPNHTKNVCRTRRYDLNLCLNCGLPGHQMKSCKQNNTNTSQNNQRGRSNNMSRRNYVTSNRAGT